MPKQRGQAYTKSLVPGASFEELNSSNELVEAWDYNGVYWLSKQKQTNFSFVNLNASCDIILPVDKTQNLFINKLILDYSINESNTSTRFWQFNLFRISSSYGFVFLSGQNSQSNFFNELVFNVNLHDNLAVTNTIYYLIQVVRNSNPGNLSLSGSLKYQIAKI